MSNEPEFGLSDYDILKETFDSLGVEYLARVTYKHQPFYDMYAPEREQEATGFAIDLLLANGDAETTFIFDLEGEFVETSLWISW